MIDVHLTTTDGRELLLTRYTEPEPELSLLLTSLKLELPAEPPPKITARARPRLPPRRNADLRDSPQKSQPLRSFKVRESAKLG